MELKGKILALDDDASFLAELKTALEPDFSVRTVITIPEALNAINHHRPDVLLLDMNMPEATGLQVLKVVKQRTSDLPVIMLTGESKSELIVSAIQSGASDYVIKGTDDFIVGLRLRISALLAMKGVKQENEVLFSKVREKYEIMGISAISVRQRAEITRFKGTNAYVLILGENGTGKELVARNLNLQEGKPTRPFVALNCGAIPANLFESELFGHAKGSFTGAVGDQMGKFVAANGGDIFLDEIGEMPLESQVKLLRVLQEKVVTPVGSNKNIHVDVRVIAATNRKLEELVQEGRFRQDLFFRLNQITLRTTPLRDRPEDILYLAKIFVNKNLPGITLAKETQDVLEKHSWPGNIRELSNTMERACFLIRGTGATKILPEHLMLMDLGSPGDVSFPAYLLPRRANDVTKSQYQLCVEWVQRTFIEKSLDILGGDNNELIQRLGISRSSYYQRKKELGVSKEQEMSSL